jgi:hypothetical protein
MLGVLKDLTLRQLIIIVYSNKMIDHFLEFFTEEASLQFEITEFIQV